MATEQHWLDALGRGLAEGRSRREMLRLAGSLALGALLHRTERAEAARQDARSGCPGGCDSPEDACCGGVCVTVTFDRDNCGRCGNACKKGWECCGGKCVDVSGKDPDNCGCCGCGCLPGQEVCIAGRCKPSCPSGKTRCGKKCVDTQTSKKHCGACINKCERGETCIEGECRCREDRVCRESPSVGPELCCAKGETCCLGGGGTGPAVTCCPPGAAVCCQLPHSGVQCCPNGSSCCGTLCCPKGASCCVGGSVAAGTACCAAGERCCVASDSQPFCCPSDKSCGSQFEECV